MLGKLLKHELIATGKILLPLNILLLLATLFGKLLIALSVFPKGELSPISSAILVILLTIYILILIALSIITIVYIVIRYYKSMFSREGYLTFTLPVSPNALLNAKTIISSFWYFITGCNTVVSIFLLIEAVVNKANQTVTYAMMDKEIFQLFKIHLSMIFVYFLILIIISSIYSVLLIFTCVNVGQLFTKHRIIAAALTYVVINFVLQIITFVITFSSQFTMLSSTGTQTAKEVANYVGTIMIGSGIMYLVLCIVFYVISSYILNKKINLE